jgi:hypothetical protein
LNQELIGEIKVLIQEECFYSVDDAFKFNKEKALDNKFKKNFHKDSEDFNPDKFKQKHEERLTLNVIKEKFNDTYKTIKYELPEALYNKVLDVIKFEYLSYYNSKDQRKRKVFETRLEQALYFCIAVYNFNLYKNNALKNSKKDKNKISYQYDVEFGCELSKTILTNIISNKPLYEIKDLLIRHKIIGNVPLFTNYVLNDETLEKELYSVSYYSKDLHEANRYFINPLYLDYNSIIKIHNKYADKHTYYLEHQLLYGNKKDSLRTDYMPFTHPEKNKQYMYAKKMSLNIPLTKIKFIERFPDLNKIYNWWKLLKNIKYKKNNYETDKEYLKSILGFKLYKEVISLFSQLIDFHNHIFKASEKYRKNLFTFT